MTHRLNLLLLALVLMVAGPFYWLLLDNPSRAVAPHPLTMARLRALGDSLPGPRPTAINVRMVASDRSSGDLLAAGAGIKRRLYSVLSYRLDRPGTAPIVIDTGIDGRLAPARHIENVSTHRQALLDADMKRAALILATDESIEMLSGLAALTATPGGEAALARARLNRWQLPEATRAAGLAWAPGLAAAPTIAGPVPLAVAPGVVVIPAGAPTPGSQMVYVHLADGREYLLAGPVAPYAMNLADLRTRSRLMDLWEGPQDRAGAMRWLVTLRALQREAPGLFIAPGHDVYALTDPQHPSRMTLID
jgi:glyoxylase-like metal-dependent hydrolase (beta-lactamase superfamily II)